MTRTTTLILVLLLLVVVIGGPCLACATVIAGLANHGCCHAQQDCEKRLPTSVSGCVTPQVDLANVEEAASPVLVASFPTGQFWISDVELRHIGLPGEPILHSPPDLFLLHSLLTI